MTQKMNLSIQVLLSCMNQADISIIKKSNLENTPTVVINQCPVQIEEHKKLNENLEWINSPTQGLSVSRNLAIKNATADICVIADDDEVFEENLSEIVNKGYALCPKADILIFTVRNRPIKFGNKPRKLTKLELLKINSVRTTFLRDSIIKNNVFFDILLGSGSGNGPGEENKFVLDCYNNGLQIYFVPIKIATVLDTNSNWFHGYDEQFFYNRGKTTRYMFGFWFALVYGVYFLIAKYKIYQKTIPFMQAAHNLFLGIWRNELKKHD